MTDREGVVGRCIARAEARSAECGLNDRTGLEQGREHAVLDKFHVNRLGCRIYIQGKPVIADTPAPQYIGRVADVLESAARAAGDDSLIDHQLPVPQFAHKIYMDLIAEGDLRALLGLMKDIRRIGQHIINRVYAARMIRHGDHWLYLAKINLHDRVIISDRRRCKALEIARAAVNLVVLTGPVICLPDGGETCCLRRHDIDSDSEIHGQIGHAGTDELHDLILDKTVLKYSSDNSQRDILRSDSRTDFSRKEDRYDLRHLNIIRPAEQLLDELGTALTHGHSSQGSIAGVAVAAQDHSSAAGQHLAGILMNDCLHRGNIDSAVLLGSCETENMIVLINCAADSAQRIVAVGQNIRNRELLKA